MSITPVKAGDYQCVVLGRTFRVFRDKSGTRWRVHESGKEHFRNSKFTTMKVAVEVLTETVPKYVARESEVMSTK